MVATVKSVAHLAEMWRARSFRTEQTQTTNFLAYEAGGSWRVRNTRATLRMQMTMPAHTLHSLGVLKRAKSTARHKRITWNLMIPAAASTAKLVAIRQTCTYSRQFAVRTLDLFVLMKVCAAKKGYHLNATLGGGPCGVHFPSPIFHPFSI